MLPGGAEACEMAAVEVPAIAAGRTIANVFGFQQSDLHTGLRQRARGVEPGETGADHRNVEISRDGVGDACGEWDRGIMVMISPRSGW